MVIYVFVNKKTKGQDTVLSLQKNIHVTVRSPDLTEQINLQGQETSQAHFTLVVLWTTKSSLVRTPTKSKKQYTRGGFQGRPCKRIFLELFHFPSRKIYCILNKTLNQELL